MKLRDLLARQLAGIASDNFEDGREYWLTAADTAIRIVRNHDVLGAATVPPALAVAARQGGDAEQAPAESPQSGGEAATPKGVS